MRILNFIFFFSIFSWTTQLVAQPPVPEDINQVIAEHKALYNKLTKVLSSTVDSCNNALTAYNNGFKFDVSLLNADSINNAIAPGDIDFQLPFDRNDLLLILDRLKIRNSSVNQIVQIVADEKSYLAGAVKAFNAKNEECQQALTAADERCKKTEVWGRKNYWRGLRNGILAGGLVGILLGVIVH